MKPETKEYIMNAIKGATIGIGGVLLIEELKAWKKKRRCE